jgi:magnesium transporter
MDLERELALEVLAAHPREAAQVAERLPGAAVAELLGSTQAKTCADLLAQMSPLAARRALMAINPDRGAKIVGELPAAVAAPLLRGLPVEARVPLLQALPGTQARAVESMLRFPEGTAGALMDPDVLALCEDLTAEDAVAAVRETPHAARYNLYVLDRAQRLVGVINQRELLLAVPKALLGSFMTRSVHRLPAEADRVAVVSHPAWREVHSLPVVDRDGRYLGAVRYRAFRALEEALRERRDDASVTARALGDLFRTGAEAVLEMLSSSEAGEGGSDHGR